MKRAGDQIPGPFLPLSIVAVLSGGFWVGPVTARGAVAIAFTLLQEFWRALAVPILLAAAFAFATPIAATVT